MKIRFNIFDFIPKLKIIEYKGDSLSALTLQTLLSFIVNQYMYNKVEGEYVEIHSSKFHLIKPDYKPYLEYMRERNILIIDYKYEVNKKSRRYAFNNYFKEHAQILEMKNDSVYKYTKKHICIEPDVLERIEQDFKAINVNDKYIEKKSRINKDGNEIFNLKSYLNNMVNIKLLKEKGGYFKLDYRIYNPFVFLSEDVRTGNIYFNDKLTNLDIRSSFPLFMALWCVDNGINKHDYDFKEYISGLKDGRFYSMLAHKLNKVKDTNNKTDISRPYYSKGTAKTSFAQWLNGTNLNKSGEIRNDDINYVFKCYFNPIMELMIKNKIDRNTFYFKLAEMEANFIFNIICKRLYNEVKGIRILTCHDSIYFESEYINQVEKIWYEELDKIYNKIGVKEQVDDDYDTSNDILFNVYEADINVIKKKNMEWLDTL